MSRTTHDDLLERFRRVDDPVIQRRQQRILEALLEASPQTRQRLVDEGRLDEARKALRRVLARRELTPSTSDDARIEACTDLVTLERRHDRAVTAASVADALA